MEERDEDKSAVPLILPDPARTDGIGKSFGFSLTPVGPFDSRHRLLGSFSTRFTARRSRSVRKLGPIEKTASEGLLSFPISIHDWTPITPRTNERWRWWTSQESVEEAKGDERDTIFSLAESLIAKLPDQRRIRKVDTRSYLVIGAKSGREENRRSIEECRHGRHLPLRLELSAIYFSYPDMLYPSIGDILALELKFTLLQGKRV
ncbi:hypothetical protein KM043_016813 [Ampulex compressa]|nr:hypothetical protein KM043_016813 [Ampulex compressa]